MEVSISVSAFIAILNETLGFAYPAVTIEGEVSGYKVNQGKWAFFDLKDETATLPCFTPVFSLKVPIEDGMSIRVTGSPKLLNWGKFSFTVKEVELAGEGELKRALELLKAKLEAEGLFEPARKRPLPNFPKRIGLVTSAGSAAYADFIKVLGARWGGLDIVLADVTVQGKSAPDSVVAALTHLNQLSDPLDVIVVIRGGGSLEDLAAFSTEPVVRAVAASRTPTIVGVGHEVDVGLADLAADLRAATPTDAARLVVPDRREILAKINHLNQANRLHFNQHLEAMIQLLDRSQLRLERFIDRPRQLLTGLVNQLGRGLQTAQNHMREQRQNVDALSRLLTGYNPTATLARGYAIVRHGQRIIKGPAGLKAGDPLMIQLAKGSLGAKVD
ncbi:MAG TPA: exodeoxyribonuclease VII large subunit [Candidatus Saccharimonadales bacterium]|nr:exodeoxyribonuclease VII large subunit [Candidatus Saccharimonadales bacterium]